MTIDNEAVKPLASAVDEPTRAVMIGCGGMGRVHLRRILADFQKTHFPVLCEPDETAYEATVELFQLAGRIAPPNQPDLQQLLADYGPELDVAFILTPHLFHFEQAKACLEAGLDVLLEKPMVMTAVEAEGLINVCRQTGRTLVVAFNGSLSPHIRTAVNMLRAGEIGEILNINAAVWQNWAGVTGNTWRQKPEISGGGFLFDTGAHMLNTVADLAGEDFTDVAAWFDYRGRPVEILAAVVGRLRSGALVTLNACGDTIPSCSSEVTVFGAKAILRTSVWGGRLEIQREGQFNVNDFEEVIVPPSHGEWEQFLAVRAGRIPNPCPPEVGLRMARLYDAIRASAGQNGMPVRWRTE